MAKKKIRQTITWSPKAIEEWKEILTYWFKRNKSNSYSKKLNLLIKDLLTLVQRNPNVGRETQIPQVRAILLFQYIVFYRLSETQIEIVSIWDGRRNPADTPFEMK
jgi:plasmid stabilization system protein ParE